MKRHRNRSRSKRQLTQAVLAKLNAQKCGYALGAAALFSTVTFSWSNDDTGGSNATVLPEVVVSDHREKGAGDYTAQELSLGKFTKPIRDIPQSVSVVSRQLLDDQHVTTMRDAVRNVAGISIAAGEGGAQGDNLTLRGFSARSDIYLDGMRDFGSYYRDAFDYEQVEVLKGPSSIAFGRGSTGGVVNQVSKVPELKGHITGEATYGTDNKRRFAVDINQPIAHIAGAALRLNIVDEKSNVAGRDVAENNHSGVAPSLVLGLGTPTRLTLSFVHEQQNDTPDYGLPWLYNAPAPVARENYYGFKGDDYLKTIADIATVKVEHDINDNLSLRDQLRYGHYTRHFSITEPQITNPVAALSAMTVNRNQISGDSVETFLQNQFDVTHKFQTACLDHTLVGGIESGRETSEPIRYTWSGVPTTSVLDPNYDQSFTGTRSDRSRVYATGDTIALYALDTVDLNEHWQVQGGARWDQFTSRYKQSVAPEAAFSRTDRMLSWRSALVYKPVEAGSIYIDYGTSFNPSAESLALSAATVGNAPEENETYEVGTKWDLFNKKVNLRAALYQTVKQNARETDPNNPTLNVLAGQQKVQGIELEAAGHVTDKWQVYGGYTFMKSRLDKSNFYPAAVGSELANVPENLFNIWTTYDLPGKLDKFQVGAGANFVDSRTASSTAPYAANGLLKELPSYWVFSGMLTYHVNSNIDVQLNVYNLTDEYYFDQIHPSHLVPGEGRTVTVSTKFKF